MSFDNSVYNFIIGIGMNSLYQEVAISENGIGVSEEAVC